MKIEVLKAIPGTSYVHGDALTIDEDQAKAWIEAGYAAEVKAAAKSSKSKAKKPTK